MGEEVFVDVGECEASDVQIDEELVVIGMDEGLTEMRENM